MESLPVKLGETYEVDIIDMTPNGEGIAKVHNFSIFVPNAKLGEHVKVQITQLQMSAADAVLVN
ncbi:MAG: TRAM domain-containing protein [Candidatus Bathyarchaeota archaeon]|nr:TRAM domain-containing protein [Candidatus Bathyarchaeota archaeon]